MYANIEIEDSYNNIVKGCGHFCRKHACWCYG